MNKDMLSNFLISLEIMWKGMAGIFIVCGFIMLFTMLVSAIIKKAAKTEKNETESTLPA